MLDTIKKDLKYAVILILNLAKQIIIRGYLLLESLDLLNKFFSCKWLTSYSHNVEKRAGRGIGGWS